MRVIIAEDEVLLREGISRILGDEGYDVVALAGDRDDLIGKVRALRPDLVVTDIRMPPTFTDEGIVAALQIRREFPAIAIVVLSQHVDTAGAVELLALGADGIGYLLKRRVMNLDEFLDSVQPGGRRRIQHRPRGDLLDGPARGAGQPGPRRRPADPAPARGAGADGAGIQQRPDRPRAGRHREGGGPQHRADLPDPRPAPVPTITAGCWRSCAT